MMDYITIDFLTKAFLLLLAVLRSMKAVKDLVDEKRFGISAHYDYLGIARVVIENKKTDTFNVDMAYFVKDYNKYWYFFRKLFSTKFSTKLKIIKSTRNRELPAELASLSNKSIFFRLDDSSYKIGDLLMWKNRPLMIRIEIAGHVILKEAKYSKTPLVHPDETHP